MKIIIKNNNNLIYFNKFNKFKFIKFSIFQIKKI